MDCIEVVGCYHKKVLHSSQFLYYVSIIHLPDVTSEMPHKSLSATEPDVIVIDADDQKKRMEGYPRLETAEGKQASSMLRRLASAGNGKVG